MKFKRTKLLILVAIFILAAVLRLYKLGDIPTGLNRDETAIGYNAYSILNTGKDEYGKSFPLYFQSFGDYKLPVYVYTTVASVKLFGLNDFAVRLPSALFGLLSVIVFYFLIKQLTRNERLSLISTFFLAIAPWSIHYNRATFEVSISLFLYLLGTLLLLWGIQKKIRLSFLVGTLLFILSLYSYNLTRLLSPVLYFGTLFLFRNDIKNISKKELIATLIVSVSLLIPFSLTFMQEGGVSSASGTLLSSSAVVKAPLIELRSYLLSIPSGLLTFLFNTPVLLTWQYVQNIAAYFSVSFFFLTGATQGNHGIGNVGQFYLFQLPLLVLGISLLLKQNYLVKRMVLLWFVATILIAAFTRDVPHATRSYFLLFPMILVIALGMERVLIFISRFKTSNLKIVAYSLILIIVSYNLIYYSSSYFLRFPVAYAKQWNEQDKYLSEYLNQNLDNYDKIIIDNNSKFPYTSYLFYNKYPPEKFHREQQRYPQDTEGFTLLRSFDKFEFRDINWQKEKANTLVVTTLADAPKDHTVLRTFFYPQRPVVLAIGQNIFQYPTLDPAYVLIEIK